MSAALPHSHLGAVRDAWRPAETGVDVGRSRTIRTPRVVRSLGMPVNLAVIATVYGAAYGLFPIAWIVFSSIMLYRLAVDTGKFEIIKDSVGSLTDDRRLQAMFIAFSFGAFIEGAAGFGAPVAVSGAMLAGLGFNPFYAAGICLLANTAPVAFGSIGIPVITLANVTGLPVLALSGMVGRLCAMVSIIIPGYLIVVMAGYRRAVEVLPAIIACGVSFAPQLILPALREHRFLRK
jgi:lactate permease